MGKCPKKTQGLRFEIDKNRIYLPTIKKWKHRSSGSEHSAPYLREGSLVEKKNKNGSIAQLVQSICLTSRGS